MGPRNPACWFGARGPKGAATCLEGPDPVCPHPPTPTPPRWLGTQKPKKGGDST